MTALVDSHAHMESSEFDLDREALLEGLPQGGVETVVSIGDNLESSRKAFALASRYDHVYATAGVHPHHASEYNNDIRKEICALLKEPKVVALGEIGLDYYYEYSPREQQKKVFTALLTAALEESMPVVIHNRDSDEDLVRILETFQQHHWKGVLHCFTGTRELARTCLDLGFYLSFSGILTFNKADEIREVANFTPMDRILIETDSPFLSPVPFRGKRNNPGNVRYVAETLAKVKGLPFETIAEQTRKNTYQFYNIKSSA